MTTFEERHPGLKGKHGLGGLFEKRMGDHVAVWPRAIAYRDEDIDATQIDKEIVRAALALLKNPPKGIFYDGDAIVGMIENVERELGL